MVKALKSLKDLQETVGKHDEVLNRILDRLDSMDQRIAAAGAVLGGLGGFVTGFNNASIFLCARHIVWLSCPAP